MIGYGTKFAVETATGSGSYFELAEITDVTPPNAQTDDVEVTHMQSPGRVKEYIPGLTDYQTMQVGMNYVPSSATDAFLRTWQTDGTSRACKITYPNAVTHTFTGYFKGYQPSAAVADKMSATLEVKVASSVVVA
jgi:predicted secreted protein